ncbi:MAG: hypothetical protein RMJ67_01200 [Elusimicrobiota bacterium]|nr:hypothetical protein [Endomicrobiia bacterium]MDW8165120.1 hypothetical protein [Elusimicrobiota bacterium]
MRITRIENIFRFLNQRRWFIITPANTPEYTARLNELIYTPEFENGEIRFIFDDNDYLEIELRFTVYKFPSDNTNTFNIEDFNRGELVYEGLTYTELYGYNITKFGSTLLAFNGYEPFYIRYPEEIKNRQLSIRVINWSPFFVGPEYKTIPSVFIKAIYYHRGDETDE